MEKKKRNIFFSLLTLIFICTKFLSSHFGTAWVKGFLFLQVHIFFIWRIGRPSCTYGKKKRCMVEEKVRVRVRVRVSPNNQSVIIVSLPVLAWAVTCCWYWIENKKKVNGSNSSRKKTVTDYFIYWSVGRVTKKNSIPSFCNRRS